LSVKLVGIVRSNNKKLIKYIEKNLKNDIF
jgi:hypothetical protein